MTRGLRSLRPLLATVLVLTAGCAAQPPVRRLQPDELRTLAGTWRGILRVGVPPAEMYSEPVEMTIRPDGSFTGRQPQRRHQFAGTLELEQGEIVIRTRANQGRLVLREGDGKRILEGEILDRAERRGVYAIRMERVADPPPSPAVTGGTRPQATVAPATWSTRVKGTYRGNLLVQRVTGTAPLEFLVTVVLADASSLSGTWTLGHGQGGVVTGHPVGRGLLRLRLLQSDPCVAEYTADVTITDDAAVLAGSLTTTSTCPDSPTGPFRLFRQ